MRSELIYILEQAGVLWWLQCYIVFRVGTILPSKIIELRKLENQNSYPLGKVTWKENSSHQSSNWSLNQVRSNRSLVFNWCVQLHNIFLVITAVLWWWGGQIYVTICTTLTRWHKSFLIGMAYSQPYTIWPQERPTNLHSYLFDVSIELLKSN